MPDKEMLRKLGFDNVPEWCRKHDMKVLEDMFKGMDSAVTEAQDELLEWQRAPKMNMTEFQALLEQGGLKDGKIVLEMDHNVSGSRYPGHTWDTC